MVAHVALPNNLKSSHATVLTVIVPASDGCDLVCPYCYIGQRNEAALPDVLAVVDYEKFLAEAKEKIDDLILCVQGYEPLLTKAFRYTETLLHLGRKLGFPVTFVSNGTHLSSHADALAALSPARIAISLDSHIPEQHDRQRGVPGTFEKVVDGLRDAVEVPELSDVIEVASVLIPKKYNRLIGMPALLAEIGIKRWTVTCLFKVGKGDVIGGPVGDRARTFHDLLILQREAEKYGIEMTVDDEFGRLSEEDMNRDVVDINRLRIHRLQRPSGVFRLMPDGRCSIGTELLQEVAEDTPRWTPGEEHAADFLQRVRNRYAAKQQATA